MWPAAQRRTGTGIGIVTAAVSRRSESGLVVEPVRAVAIMRVFGTNPHGGDQHPVRGAP